MNTQNLKHMHLCVLREYLEHNCHTMSGSFHATCKPIDLVSVFNIKSHLVPVGSFVCQGQSFFATVFYLIHD
ncbi:hypothetical protein BpHYR1_050304 [Brachionus plicatilis]|uniref:Uncharacterized protein n=1 Tax=Brachionus plicatilis TaxID=10195 RepID=A0A3M7R3M2_BRAPC|nr:hypothetical protein BpHYR1_050304 [Brachionus plicatilis]